MFVLILTCGNKAWLMTESVLSQIQTAEMAFLQRVDSVTLCNKMHSCKIHKAMNVRSLIL